MIKHKIAILLIIIAIVSFITGCEKITASIDGVDKEETAEPAGTAPETITEQEAEESTSGLTGSAVAETEEVKNIVNTVKMTADGFSPDKLYIKVGDKVVWENTRSGTINKAMIIGVRECSKVRSSFLKPGESFSWTFDTPMTCTLADGIMTTKESKIFVEE